MRLRLPGGYDTKLRNLAVARDIFGLGPNPPTLSQHQQWQTVLVGHGIHCHIESLRCLGYETPDDVPNLAHIFDTQNLAREAGICSEFYIGLEALRDKLISSDLVLTYNAGNVAHATLQIFLKLVTYGLGQPPARRPAPYRIVAISSAGQDTKLPKRRQFCEFGLSVINTTDLRELTAWSESPAIETRHFINRADIKWTGQQCSIHPVSFWFGRSTVDGTGQLKAWVEQDFRVDRPTSSSSAAATPSSTFGAPAQLQTSTNRIQSRPKMAAEIPPSLKLYAEIVPAACGEVKISPAPQASHLAATRTKSSPLVAPELVRHANVATARNPNQEHYSNCGCHHSVHEVYNSAASCPDFVTRDAHFSKTSNCAAAHQVTWRRLAGATTKTTPCFFMDFLVGNVCSSRTSSGCFANHVLECSACGLVLCHRCQKKLLPLHSLTKSGRR